MIKRFLIPSGKIETVKYIKFISAIIANGILSGTSSSISTHEMFSVISNENLTNNFIGKDILGQLGLLFATGEIAKKESKYILKSSLIIYEVSNLVECCTPFFSETYFIPIASIANIGKNVGFISLGAFNSEVISKLSIDKTNIPQIYSKVAVISSVSFSLGMALGLYSIKIFPEHNSRIQLVMFLGVLRYLILTNLMPKFDD